MAARSEEQRVNELLDILYSLSDTDLISIINDYYDSDGSDHIYYVEEFDEVYQGSTPLEIANDVEEGDFHTNFAYFYIDAYGYSISFNSMTKSDNSPFVNGDTDVARFILDNDEDCGIQEIRDFLDTSE